MPEKQLREALERLRSEVTSAGIEPASAQRLQVLITEIEGKLEHPTDADQHHDLVGNLKEAITHFETEHPRATGILNDIMVALGNMGI